MEFIFVDEFLHLVFHQHNKEPKAFIDFFNHSKKVIAFNYRISEKRFTHFSSSFKRIFGYKSKKILKTGIIPAEVIYPQDLKAFNQFFDNSRIDGYPQHLQNGLSELKKMKCRINHEPGRWKTCIIFSIDVRFKSDQEKYKAGIISFENGYNNSHFVSKNSVIKSRNSKYYKNNKFNNDQYFIDHITNREIEILNMIGEGLVAKQIADKLNISTNTVISHRNNLITKMQVKNTAELINKASHLMII